MNRRQHRIPAPVRLLRAARWFAILSEGEASSCVVTTATAFRSAGRRWRKVIASRFAMALLPSSLSSIGANAGHSWRPTLNGPVH